MSASNDRDVARVLAAACEPGRGRQPGEGAEFVDQVRLVVEAAVNGDAGPVDGAVAVHLCDQAPEPLQARVRSEEHTSELQSLMRISYAVFCLTNKTRTKTHI